MTLLDSEPHQKQQNTSEHTKTVEAYGRTSHNNGHAKLVLIGHLANQL